MVGAGRQSAHSIRCQLSAVRPRYRTQNHAQPVPQRTCARQSRLSTTAAPIHGFRLHRRHSSGAHPRQVQFRVLRTCIPGRENRRGARVPRRPRSRGQQSVLPRLCRQETPRRRGLPPSVRRISRPVRVQPGFRDRRAGNPVRLQVGQCGDRQRSGQRRGRRQGHLLFRAEHDPLLSRRRADSAQCADLHADVRQGPQGGTRQARRTGHQGCGGSGRLRRRVRLIARPVATRGTGRTHQGRTAPVHRAGGHPIQEHRRSGPRNRTDEPT